MSINSTLIACAAKNIAKIQLSELKAFSIYVRHGECHTYAGFRGSLLL